VRGEEIVALAVVAGRELGKPAHGAEEAGRGMRIEPGLARNLNAFLVGRQFLLLAEGGELHLGAVGRLVGLDVAAEDAGDHLVDDLVGAHAVGARPGMLEHDVSNFMRQHGGQFAGIGSEREDTARDVDIAAGQREGVDLGGVENGDGELGARLVGSDEKPPNDPRQHHLGLAVLVDAAIGGDDARVLARPDHVFLGVVAGLHDRRPLPLRLLHGDIGPEAGATGEREQQRDGHCGVSLRNDATQNHHRAARTSICSG
jgi:hypothetical protein